MSNLKIHSQKHIRLIALDKGTHVLVCAVVVVREGETIVSVSNPRVVRVIQKNAQALDTHMRGVPLLTGATVSSSNFFYAPYFQKSFFTEIELISWFSARPPTHCY